MSSIFDNRDFHFQGQAEITQNLQKIKSGAYQILGGFMLSLGDQDLAYFWIEPAGQALIQKISERQQQTEGTIAIISSWEASFPENYKGEAIARLNLEFSFPLKENLRVWFDVAQHAHLLNLVLSQRKLLLVAAEPKNFQPEIVFGQAGVALTLDCDMTVVKRALGSLKI
jgi:hypothetical protein